MGEHASIVRLTLPPEPTSVALARRFLRDHSCPGRRDTERVDAAVLLVSELVTNAVRHGAPPITLEVECDRDDMLHVRVSDASADIPAPARASPQDDGGRGLAITELLSDAWGVDPRDDGKTVWFRLRLNDDP